MTDLWTPPRESIRWYARATVAKYWADDDLSPVTLDGPYGARRATPFEVIEGDNLLVTTGATLLMDRLCGVTSTALDATNGRICVGDSAVATTVGMTDLQAATNKVRQVVDAAPSRAAGTTQWVSTFAAGVATFTWNECGLANAASGANLVNRIQQSFGAKGAGQQFILTISATLA
jgi:hypothetical protein